MNCPYCHSSDSKVVDSRTVNRDGTIRRRRECLSCSQRYTTYEYVVSQPLLVVKKNGTRAEYDRQRIEESMRIACNKRPVSAERIMEAVVSPHPRPLPQGEGTTTRGMDPPQRDSQIHPASSTS